jgi:hypothetical protein
VQDYNESERFRIYGFALSADVVEQREVKEEVVLECTN